MRFGWVQDNCKDWDPVPGIRNPLCGIQDPKLSWIPFHGARECIHIMCIFKKRTSLGMHYCFEWSRGGGGWVKRYVEVAVIFTFFVPSSVVFLNVQIMLIVNGTENQQTRHTALEAE